MSDIVITAQLKLAITDEVRNAYINMCRDRYSNYAAYKTACKGNGILDSYIRTHLFTSDMYAVWRNTEPFVGVKTEDIRVKRLQLYRKRLQSKINNFKYQLGKLAYPHAELIRRNILWCGYGSLVVPTIKELTNIDANKKLEDCCAICSVKHMMSVTSELSCGHQYGTSCIKKWLRNNDSCPLCRAVPTSVTCNTRVKDNKKRYFTEEEAEDKLAAMTVLQEAQTLDGDFIRLD